MPSTSKKQHNFMEAVAHSPAFAKKAGVPQSVGKDFSNADKGRKFSKGGIMAKSDMKEDMAMDKDQDKAMIKKAFKQHDAQEHKGGKGTKLKLADGGLLDTSGALPLRAIAALNGTLNRDQPPTHVDERNKLDRMNNRPARPGMFVDPAISGRRSAIGGMKKGGSVSSASNRGDGIAQRGKTKGTMIMCGGGMTKGKK